jgi:hypothetical protein
MLHHHVGNPGPTRTDTLLTQNQALYQLSYKAIIFSIQRDDFVSPLQLFLLEEKDVI